jgi:hypothetical protein
MSAFGGKADMPLGRGWSILHGDFEITPEAIGSWGKHHHAIRLAGDSIYDSQLGRDRKGIEIHSPHHMESAGCVLVDPSVFEELRYAIIAMTDEAGSVFLYIGLDGVATAAGKASPFPPIIDLTQRTKSNNTKSAGLHQRHHHPTRFAKIHNRHLIA